MNDKCPVCGSYKQETMGISNASFHMWSCGAVYMHCCLDCGTIFLPSEYLKRARTKYKERHEKVNKNE